MSGYMELSDGTSSISFAPLINPGIRKPEDRNRGYNQYDGGKRQYWDTGGATREEFALNNISHADAVQLNLWWRNLTILEFRRDLDGAPADFVYTRLNPAGKRPFQWMFGQEVNTKYEATVTIPEVSSSST